MGGVSEGKYDEWKNMLKIQYILVIKVIKNPHLYIYIYIVMYKCGFFYIYTYIYIYISFSKHSDHLLNTYHILGIGIFTNYLH